MHEPDRFLILDPRFFRPGEMQRLTWAQYFIRELKRILYER